ncbi:hypothetical protein [Amycolatopsis australiensis]|uniref:Uncharacterized protein n=1 Tax=Amycolatopsis australiensis TaxID=546364 RepID=A0A1K1LKU9_9PSEU|nr:hypothetical protein [Amycolatopsis australiensis]SFW11504.1 hypothetical protein SAMN04489730_0025 [Amycolatopsis australiensis]
MRGTTARSSTSTSALAGALTPACRSTDFPRPRRRQGRTALGGLPSTAEFTNSRLTPDDRKLILFLLVCLADDDDALTETYHRLLAVYGDREGHWCATKDVPSLRRRVAKFLGKGAETTPGWNRIVDMIEAVLPPTQREQVLARAAALYSRAHQRDKPTRDYTGPVVPPAWADEPTVTVEMIRAELAESAAVPAFAALTCPAPGASTPVTAPAAGPVSEQPAAARPVSEDPAALWEMLWAVVDGFRQRSEELDRVRAQRDLAREQVQNLQAQNWRLRADNHRASRLAEQLLREQHPTVPPETIRLLLDERLESAVSPRPVKPRTLHG